MPSQDQGREGKDPSDRNSPSKKKKRKGAFFGSEGSSKEFPSKSGSMPERARAFIDNLRKRKGSAIVSGGSPRKHSGRRGLGSSDTLG